MKKCYVPRKFSADSLLTIVRANEIIEQYQAQGYDLTLRQLYYQFVARDFIPNTVQQYKRLGGIISDARRAGLVDWDAIVDRTRALERLNFWNAPEDIIKGSADGFHMNRWQTQPVRVEVWFEKEALAGIFEKACDKWDVPYLACRGYPSDSEVWSAAQRLRRYRLIHKQPPIILHFGDHDPSGIDMTRDIIDRLSLFGEPVVPEVRRLALNMDQVEEYQPPPNPAKDTDSRFASYQAEHGDSSWELDALEPQVLADLVEEEVKSFIDWEAWNAREAQEEKGRTLLQQCYQNWTQVADFLEMLEDQGDEDPDDADEDS